MKSLLVVCALVLVSCGTRYSNHYCDIQVINSGGATIDDVQLFTKIGGDRRYLTSFGSLVSGATSNSQHIVCTVEMTSTFDHGYFLTYYLTISYHDSTEKTAVLIDTDVDKGHSENSDSLESDNKYTITITDGSAVLSKL